MVLLALILVAAVANLNLSVANVALPSIGLAFDASQTQLDLVAVGYSLGLAASVLWLGALGDRSTFRPVTLGDRPAHFSKQPREGGLTALSWVIDAPKAPLVMALIVPSGQDEGDAVQALTGGAKRITEPALRNLGPLRVRVSRLTEARSLRTLIEAGPTHTNLSTLALLNGVEPDQQLPAGSWVKRIEP